MKPNEPNKQNLPPVRKVKADGRHPSRRPTQIPFPFMQRRKLSPAEWVYNHRVGLLSMVTVYLLLGVLILSYKIVVKPVPLPTIEIEIVQEQIDEMEQEKLEQKEQHSEMVEYDEVMNTRSNDDSELDASLSDDRHQNNDIYNEAERVMNEMQQSKNDYNDAMASLAEKTKPKSMKNTNDGQKSEKNERARVKGNVTVRYMLKDRHDIYLHIPAYECQGGGEVMVGITVNNNGEVIAASIINSAAGTDDCVRNMALQAAKASSFNSAQNAPAKQKGSITYIFIPQ